MDVVLVFVSMILLIEGKIIFKDVMHKIVELLVLLERFEVNELY